MVTQDKIEEWLKETEDRPASALAIIQLIAARLTELTKRNEELFDENIQLRSGQRVEFYESRIASLEYQLELLKRQFNLPGTELGVQPTPAPAMLSLLVFHPSGLVLRAEPVPDTLQSSGVLASFSGEVIRGEPPRLLVTSSHEELLLVFDTGKTMALPAADIPAVGWDALDWQAAKGYAPAAGDELVDILPIARLPLYEYCIQASRRAFVKKIQKSYLETFLAGNYIGAGVNLKSDKSFGLTLCNKNDLFILVSQEGYLLSFEVNRLPVAIDNVMRLSASDHIVSAFNLGAKPSLLVVTQNGRLIHRDKSWLEPGSAYRTKGQSLYSQERRNAGVLVVGAAAVGETDWGIALTSDGKVTAHPIGYLFNKGRLFDGDSPQTVLGFTTFSAPAEQ